MAMAALRKEGRRLSPLFSPHPMNALRSSLLPAQEETMGVRCISTQIVRNRMKSVKNIQKITKAMKMVAASKLRQIQTKAEKSRGFWQPFTALLGDTPSIDVKKTVIVTISSDKGLCGGINSTSVKISRGIHKLNSGPEKEAKFVVLGEKAKAQLLRDSKKDIDVCITELQKNPLNYTQVSVMADEILKNVQFDALKIVFNKFSSVVSFIPTMSTVLSPEIVEREAEAGGKLGDLDLYEIEGGDSKSEILQNLTEFQFSCVMFNGVLENACSEQGARMSAMDSSSRNAGEMLDQPVKLPSQLSSLRLFQEHQPWRPNLLLRMDHQCKLLDSKVEPSNLPGNEAHLLENLYRFLSYFARQEQEERVNDEEQKNESHVELQSLSCTLGSSKAISHHLKPSSVAILNKLPSKKGSTKNQPKPNYPYTSPYLPMGKAKEAASMDMEDEGAGEAIQWNLSWTSFHCISSSTNLSH
ncbi:hypothetical protein V2J09_014927 [Rumex salicifolius]